MKKVSFALLAGALLATLSWMDALAAEFPEKPIRIIVPYAPGGGGDILARMYAEKLKVELGQPVIVDNKPGAGTLIGSELVAKAPADGYTLLFTTNSVLIAPILNAAAAKFDPLKDLAPVVPIGSIAVVLVAHPAVPANTTAELVAYLKKNPNKVSFASSGTGGITHLAGELFKMLTGTKLTHVPYRGAGPAMQDLLAGHVQMMFDGLGSSAAQIEGGKLRALAVASSNRAAAFPNVPTAAEAGLKGYEVSTWYAMWAPKNTPAPVIERMTAELKIALAKPALIETWRKNGSDTPNLYGADFGKFVTSEVARWGEVVRKSAVKLD